MIQVVKQPRCLHCSTNAHYKLSRGHFSFFTCAMHLDKVLPRAKERLGLPFLISRLVSEVPKQLHDYSIDELRWGE